MSKIAGMMHRDWFAMLENEGTEFAVTNLEPSEDGELPCPACGTVAPLVDGACSDCGLQLE